MVLSIGVMFKRFLLLATVCILGAVSLNAQDKHYQFSRLDIGDGLSHNLIRCFYKDRNGFMWIATGSGLNRYDGYTFKVYKHSGDTAALTDNDITGIYEGPFGKIWVATMGGFNIYNTSTDKFEHDPDKQLSAMHVPDIKDRKSVV